MPWINIQGVEDLKKARAKPVLQLWYGSRRVHAANALIIDRCNGIACPGRRCGQALQ
jgi:hypothetical protein